MVKVIFKINGQELETDIASGERILKAAWKLQLDEKGFGECGGNCSCATCHVRVKEGLEYFKPRSSEEEDMLDTLPEIYKDSRLACQLHVNDDHKCVVVEVPDRE